MKAYHTKQQKYIIPGSNTDVKLPTHCKYYLTLQSRHIFFQTTDKGLFQQTAPKQKNLSLIFFPTDCFSPNNLPSDLPSLLRFLLWTSLIWIPTLAAVSLQNISQAPHSKTEHHYLAPTWILTAYTCTLHPNLYTDSNNEWKTTTDRLIPVFTTINSTPQGCQNVQFSQGLHGILQQLNPTLTQLVGCGQAKDSR